MTTMTMTQVEEDKLKCATTTKTINDAMTDISDATAGRALATKDFDAAVALPVNCLELLLNLDDCLACHTCV